MKLYQLKNGNIEIITREHKDGTKEGIVIRMEMHPDIHANVAVSYCRTFYDSNKHKCEKCGKEHKYDEFRAWKIEKE